MRFLDVLDRMSNLRNLGVMILASIVVVSIMGIATQTWVYSIYGDVTMPDTRLAYTFAEMEDVFNTLGQEGLNIWAQVHMLDFLFPLTYMFAMVFGMNMEIRRIYTNNANVKKLVLIPIFGGLADYVENILVLSQIAAFPSLSETVIMIASAVTTLKWIFLGAGFAIIFVFVVLFIIKRGSQN